MRKILLYTVVGIVAFPFFLIGVALIPLGCILHGCYLMGKDICQLGLFHD